MSVASRVNCASLIAPSSTYPPSVGHATVPTQPPARAHNPGATNVLQVVAISTCWLSTRTPGRRRCWKVGEVAAVRMISLPRGDHKDTDQMTGPFICSADFLWCLHPAAWTAGRALSSPIHVVSPFVVCVHLQPSQQEGLTRIWRRRLLRWNSNAPVATIVGPRKILTGPLNVRHSLTRYRVCHHGLNSCFAVVFYMVIIWTFCQT